MEQIIQQVFDGFKENRPDIGPQWQIIDQLVAEDKTDVLYELGIALKKSYSKESYAPKWAIKSVYDRLEHGLALTPGMKYAQIVINLLLSSEPHPWSLDERSRELAPLLATAQSIDTLLDLIKAYRQDEACTEFLAILVQEMILHDIRCDQFPLILDFIDQLRAISHPLAELPLALLRIEQPFPRLHHRKTWDELERERISFLEREPALYSKKEVKVIIEESTTDSEQERIQVAITPWTNAKSEARTFVINQAVAANHVSESLLLSLPLLSLKGVHSPDLSLKQIPPRNACCKLFASASQGGPYDHGHGGAYGRLETWHSLAGLVGTPESASIEEIALLVEQCGWFSFTAKNDWFYLIAWDLGILTLRPDRRSLAILAVTATD